MERSNVTSLREALDSRRFSATELAIHYLSRIHMNKNLNAFISIDAEQTLEQASVADARLASGERTPLLGLPIAHKDIFVTRKWPTTAASKMLADYRSPFDATVVEKLYAAGMVCIGKTNMDEFAMGSSNENSYFGAVLNPWDRNAVSGGSSGGSAVAVIADLCVVATGSDTGGSIRQPASLSGVTGIKPTYGRVSRHGMIAFASSLDQAGPMACSAADCAYVLSTIAGMDIRDSTTIDRDTEDFTRYLDKPMDGAEIKRPLSGLRIGLPKEYFGDKLSEDVRNKVEQALSIYKELGASLVDVSLPRTELSIPVYYALAMAEASSNLSRFDGIRFGYRSSKYSNMLDMYRKSRMEGFGDEVKRRILIGTCVLSKNYYNSYYLQAQRIRRIIAEDFQQTFHKCDVLMTPVSPVVAWNLKEENTNLLSACLNDMYTVSVNLAGLPGMSLPCGFGINNRPVGLQIIGNYFDEARMLQIAHAFQRVTDWHTRIPNGI